MLRRDPRSVGLAAGRSEDRTTEDVEGELGDGQIPQDLQNLLDQLIVPLLVERIVNTKGHLYSAMLSQDNPVEPLARAA